MDIKIVLISYIVLLIVICVFMVMYLHSHFKYEKMKKEYERLDSMYDSACIEIEQLRASERIKSKNKKEADEKINNLLNGNISADDVLPKRKGRL